jgi:hypothetical protein
MTLSKAERKKLTSLQRKRTGGSSAGEAHAADPFAQ